MVSYIPFLYIYIYIYIAGLNSRRLFLYNLLAQAPLFPFAVAVCMCVYVCLCRATDRYLFLNYHSLFLFNWCSYIVTVQLHAQARGVIQAVMQGLLNNFYVTLASQNAKIIYYSIRVAVTSQALGFILHNNQLILKTVT